MAKVWSGMDPLAVLSDDSEDEADLDERVENKGGECKSEKDKATKATLQASATTCGPAAESAKKKSLDFEAISRHGYKGGPSILFVPPPKQVVEQSWDWGQGKRKAPGEEEAIESFEERQRLREVANERSVEVAAQAIMHSEAVKKQRRDAAEERKDLSFSQKEKRKRDLGQASRGKNYVEEEKRLLRDQGVYSGFDA